MDLPEAIKELKLHHILRYTLAGSFSIVSYHLYFTTAPASLVKTIQDTWSATLMLSVLLGVTLYIIHRAVLFPILGRLALSIAETWTTLSLAKKARRWCLYRPTKLELDLDISRWERRGKGSIQDGLDEWGGQIHFLYCGAWAVLFGNLLASASHAGPETWNYPVIGMFLLFLVSAFFADARQWHYEIELKPRPAKDAPELSAGSGPNKS